MRGALAAIALAAAASGATAATVDDLEACVQRFPGERTADRKACFEALVAPRASPADRPAARPLPDLGLRFEKGDSPSPFRRLWGDSTERSSWRTGGYKTNYFMPAFYSRNPNPAPFVPAGQAGEAAAVDRESTEAKFQFSMKGHLWPKDDGGRHDLWFGYTQVSHWQIWNAEASRPFRESSYEPEILYTYESSGIDWAGWRLAHVGIAINHNSNGRGGDLSRSWNRAIAFARAEKGGTLVTLRAWARILETGRDDNPGIGDYFGRAELQVEQRFANGVNFAVTGRHSLRTGARSRGALQLDLSTPLCRDSWPASLCVDSLRAFVQGYHGYAESLLDYNYKDSYIGIGVSLGDSR